MIHIRRIQPEDIPAAKAVIYGVAHKVFHETKSLEESIAFYESQGKLRDMEDYQQRYNAAGGIFLVTTDEDRVIGTGAIRRIDDETCELKRLWLLFEYHGLGLGYRMMQELLSFARQQGYLRIRLETDPIYQRHAVGFYKRLGFHDIPRYGDDENDIALEMLL